MSRKRRSFDDYLKEKLKNPVCRATLNVNGVARSASGPASASIARSAYQEAMVLREKHDIYASPFGLYVARLPAAIRASPYSRAQAGP